MGCFFGAFPIKCRAGGHGSGWEARAVSALPTNVFLKWTEPGSNRRPKDFQAVPQPRRMSEIASQVQITVRLAPTAFWPLFDRIGLKMAVVGCDSYHESYQLRAVLSHLSFALAGSLVLRSSEPG